MFKFTKAEISDDGKWVRLTAEGEPVPGAGVKTETHHVRWDTFSQLRVYSHADTLSLESIRQSFGDS